MWTGENSGNPTFTVAHEMVHAAEWEAGWSNSAEAGRTVTYFQNSSGAMTVVDPGWSPTSNGIVPLDEVVPRQADSFLRSILGPGALYSDD